jgi:hypothetical protein
MHGTGAFDLGGKAGTMDLTESFKSFTLTAREILLNGQVYLGMSVNGRSLVPTGKTWIAEQATAAQKSGITGLTGGGDPTAELTSLANHGITVSALGTKDIGGVSCTGYAVTPPGEPDTITVWINPQHLVREFSMNATVDVSAGLSGGGASASAAPTGTTTSASIDLTMDFTYSAARHAPVGRQHDLLRRLAQAARAEPRVQAARAEPWR